MLDFLFTPEYEIEATGNLKQHRKVMLDLNGTISPDLLKDSDITWSISKEGIDEETQEKQWLFDESHSNEIHKELLFQRAGTYHVDVKVKKGDYEYTASKDIIIDADLAPTAGFSLESNYYFRGNQNSQEISVSDNDMAQELKTAEVIISDKSISEDGDTIGQRIWMLYFDANNNGEFEDSEKQIVSDGNETQIILSLDHVGKYKVILMVKEHFDDTIPSLIDDSVFLVDDTQEYEDSACVFNIKNEAPKASINMSKAMTADILISACTTDTDILNLSNKKAEELKQKLEAQGVDARIEKVTSESYSTQNHFDWKEYLHNGFESKSTPLMDHVEYDGNDIKMLGYNTSFKDFLYILDESSENKTFEFDMHRGSEWYSLEGAGFLFNTSVSETDNTIKGFCMMLTQQGLVLDEINCNDLAGFRDGNYEWVQYAGKLLQSFPIDDLYADHHFKLEVYKNTVSVWDGDNLIIDHYVLPKNDYGYGYGPIASYIPTNIYQTTKVNSYVTFKNLKIDTVKGQKLTDFIDEYDWREDASHFVINLNDTSVPELSNEEDMSDLAAALIKNDATFIGIGNDSNENQYDKLLNTIQSKGSYLPLDKKQQTLDEMNSYLTDVILSKDYSIGDRITKDVTVCYEGVYEDTEGDPIYSKSWEYDYNPSLSMQDGNHNIEEFENPIQNFEKTGSYVIRLKVCDNPVSGNDIFEEYREWSDTAQSEKLLLVHTRPKAQLKVQVENNPEDAMYCIPNVSYEAWDEDHEKEADKGISEEKFYYKNSKDNEWTEGKLPDKLLIGETYLVKYEVRDIEGSWSYPDVVVVKTSEFMSNQVKEDNEPPVIYLEADKYTAEFNEYIYITGYAVDNYGVQSFSVDINDIHLMSIFSTKICFGTGSGAMQIVTTAHATDTSGNTSEKTIVIDIVDNKDKTAPIAEITEPCAGSIIGSEIQIKGNAFDETQFDKYTLSYKAEEEDEYHVFKEGKEEVRDGLLGSLDISEFRKGAYQILLTARDASGNENKYGISFHVDSNPYELTSAITDIQYDKESGILKIFGTAEALGMKGYTLLCQKENEGAVTIAEGTLAIKDGLLGTINQSDLSKGNYHLTLTVSDEDSHELATVASFQYSGKSGDFIKDVNAPLVDITDIALSDNKENLDFKGTIKDDVQLNSYTIEFAKEDDEYKPLVSGTENIEDAILTSIKTEGLESGTYHLKITASDVFGNACILTATFTYEAESQDIRVGEQNKQEQGTDSKNTLPEDPITGDFAVKLSRDLVTLGSEVDVQITLPGNVSENSLSIFLDDKELAKGMSKTSFKAEKLGTNTITAKAMKDDEELVVSANCIVYDGEDQEGPKGDITAPEEGAILTKPTDIIGSAYDTQNLDFYRLEYRMKGEEEYHLITQCKESKKDDVLGTFDTTMLRNGRYDVRLWVQDHGRHVRKVTRNYTVEGNLKVGAMNIGFTDLTSKIGNATINVNRMYDSRNKAKGDFGYGWTLGVNGMNITESNPVTKGYKMIHSGSVIALQYQIVQTRCHDVMVSYGDGTSDRFKLVVNPERSYFTPIRSFEVSFECVTNQGLKLELLDNDNNPLQATIDSEDNIYFLDSIDNNEYHYRLTDKDGVETYLKAETGVYKIVDKQGDEILVDQNGYHGSDGKGINFVRDEEGRVTTATNTDGDVISYAYDEKGDLTSVTDEACRTVTFTYDGDHNLISIIDPMGIATAVNEYDDNGRLIAVTDADGNRMEYKYDVEGRTQEIKDRRGNTTVYTYDDNGNVLQTIDPYGNKTSSTYDELNHVLTKTDAKGNTTSYGYDGSGNLTKVTAPDGTVVESSYTQENYVSSIKMLDKTVVAMDYGDKGEIQSVTDARGNQTTYSYTADGKLTGIADEIGAYQKVSYDEKGNVASTTNGAGESASYTYDENGNATSVTISRTENGETKTFTSHYSYDKDGNISQATDNAGNVTSYTYDANGNQTTSTDAKNRQIHYSYDDRGNMTGAAYPDGTSESFTYDANGNNISATDRNGQTGTMVYDKLDRLIEKKYADGTKESYKYDEIGNLVEQISTSGAKTSYTYDNRNLNTSLKDTFGNETVFTYDKMARLIQKTDAKGNEIKYTYDDNGNITQTTYADGSCVKSAYDARNRVTEQTDQNGNKTSYTYNGADRLTGVADAYGNKYTYTYDGNGNLVTVEDADGNQTGYTYDAVGHVESITSAKGQTMHFQYDASGLVTESTDYAGNKTVYTYDDQDRLIKKQIGDEITSYTYNEKNLLSQVTDKSGTISYTSDQYNRLSSKKDAQDITVSYTYDEAGRIKTFTNGFDKAEYEYDKMDRITRVIDHNGKATVYEYDALGNRSVVRYPDGTVMSYTYDSCQRLTEECITDASGKQLAKYSYGLGKAGERTSITEIDSEGKETKISYEYDKLGRLTKEVMKRGDNQLTNTYAYDKVSNRTEKQTTIKGDIKELADTSLNEVKITEGFTAYAYNELNQMTGEVSETESITYTYDENGNLIKQSVKNNGTGNVSNTVDYSYDKENHLLKATIQSGNKVTIESYTYDYNGNRTSRQMNDLEKTYYVNDTNSRTGLTQVVAETDESGKKTASYLRGEELLSMERDGKTCYYLYDGHGSVRGLLSTADSQTAESQIATKLTDTYNYDAYGNLLKKEGSTKNEFLYSGEQYNANTGLYYLRARYMNPSTGTFISMDSYQGSLFDPISLHKYLYANADPVMNVDLSGYMTVGSEFAGSLGESILIESNAFYNSVIINISNALLGMSHLECGLMLINCLLVTILFEILFNPDNLNCMYNWADSINTYKENEAVSEIPDDVEGENEEDKKKEKEEYDKDLGALDQLGKELEEAAKRGKKISEDEARIIDEWVKEYGKQPHGTVDDYYRHPHWKEPHTHIGNKHIPFIPN